MRTDSRLALVIVLLLTAGACQTPVPSGTAPASAAASPGSSPGATPGPTATPAPPATTAFAELADTSIKGHLRIATSLTAGGQPVAAGTVTVTVTALGKTYRTIVMKGIVPTLTKSLQVGFRFNQEGAGPAPIDMKIYRITYADGGSPKNRVPNSNFASGFYHWAVYGSGSAQIERSDVGDGRMLHIRAKAGQDVAINSFSISVTPGSDFTLRVTASVPPAGTVTGYASTFFLWGKKLTEGYRQTLDLVAPAIPVQTLSTDTAGAVAIDQALPAGSYLVEIAYAGDATYAASKIEAKLSVP